MGQIFDWIDDRFKVKAPHKDFLERKLPENLNYSYCLGGAALTFFIINAITGVMLSIYYVPSESEAFSSIVRIQKEVPLGWLVRGMHKWSASLFIIIILFHTLRVFISKAYRPPRELNWIVGSFTLIIAFASGFTGYLLPWDQRAYWATEVGTSMAGTVPLIGSYILYLVRGGIDIDGTTLIRFYSIHILWNPFLMIVLLWAHFHMVKRQRIKGGL